MQLRNGPPVLRDVVLVRESGASPDRAVDDARKVPAGRAHAPEGARRGSGACAPRAAQREAHAADQDPVGVFGYPG